MIPTMTETTLVSNLGQTTDSSNLPISTNFDRAQGFRTGPTAGGYAFSEVVADIEGADSVVQPVVGIYTASGGNPGTLVYTLTNPATLGTGERTWTAPANATLAANTSYFVVFGSSTGSFRLRRTIFNAEDSESASGWTIGNNYRWRHQQQSWNTASSMAKIAIRNVAAVADTTAPGFSTAAVNGTTLTLTWDEALDTAHTPGNDAFTVEADDTGIAVTGVSVSGSAVTVTVARASGGSTDVTFDTSTASGVQSTLTFTTSDWSAAQTVTVSAAQDSDTANDSATLSHTASGGGYDSYSASLAVTVTDDDTVAAPLVTVSASATSIEEGAAVTITFTASPPPTDDLEVFYEIEGGSDFGLPTTEQDVEIGAGETSATVVLQTTPDSAAATDATVTVALATDVDAEGDGYTVGSPNSVDVRVTQSDAPTVSVSATPATILEGAAITVTFTAAETLSADLVVKYRITGGQAFGLGESSATLSATIPSGGTSVAVVHDTDTDQLATGSDKTVSFGIQSSVTSAGADYLIGTRSAAVTVQQDTTPTIVYAGSFTEAAANDGTVTGSVTATLTGDTFAAGTGTGGTTAAGVTASNVPVGLTAVLTRTSDRVVTLTLTGNATNHADGNDVNNVTLTFTDAAFAHEAASRVSGATRNDIAIDFNDPSSDAPLAPDLSGVTVSVSGQTLGFNWESQAADASRAAVTGYRVEWSADGATGWTAITPDLGAPATPGTSRIFFSEQNVPAGTTRYYRVFALSDSGDSPASGTVSGTAADDGATPRENRAPTFAEGDSATRSVAENTPAGRNIGAPLRATDADGDTLTWSLGGTDAASFDIVSSSGQLRTRAALDYEIDNNYTVTVEVADGNGGSDTIDVTVTVTEIDPPLAPSGLTTAADGENVIALSWTAPATDPARAAVTGYRVERSADGESGWSALTMPSGAGATSHRHTGLDGGTTWHYRVFALSTEGDSVASAVVSATTDKMLGADGSFDVHVPDEDGDPVQVTSDAGVALETERRDTNGDGVEDTTVLTFRAPADDPDHPVGGVTVTLPDDAASNNTRLVTVTRLAADDLAADAEPPEGAEPPENLLAAVLGPGRLPGLPAGRYGRGRSGDLPLRRDALGTRHGDEPAARRDRPGVRHGHDDLALRGVPRAQRGGTGERGDDVAVAFRTDGGRPCAGGS